MFKKLAAFLFLIVLLVNICGCVALVAGGAAGGAGTAVWLSGKLTQYVNASLEQATQAAKDSLPSFGLKIVMKEAASGPAVAQIRSRDVGGEKVYIDIHKITGTRSRIEVRVGTIISNRPAADRILKSITDRL
ncbi:MAG: DUF3568 family protein [Candidatus Omnitrophica bacterium]|nr:DUF3568 family protein [Candidatus Omnitrophota bacterium]MDD5027774.1 DUF3568 family protein [Candidatus Omnitrophota bacterium]MDD5661597.1 DUF3568 family protein [Candidatus Omnitrophota bacterium]